MKQLSSIVFLIWSCIAFSQTGEISGVILDEEYNNQPLPFADVYIKGTTKGASTDFDGKFTISNVPAGENVVIITFVGYETKQVAVTVKEGETVTISESLSAGQSLDAVVVQATSAVKESEASLLREQKKVIVVKESIGAEELAKKGVSDAAAAATKIAGVTKSESSSEIFIRGLGDRYLSTTLNGLPVPSDDVGYKNINLDLFDSSIIQNVSISKTYSSDKYADQASGSVDVKTKRYSKDFFTIGITGGINQNVLGQDFKVSVNNANNTLGFYNSNFSLREAITQQKWVGTTTDNIARYGLGVAGAKKFYLGENALKLSGSLSYGRSANFEEGFFAQYRGNSIGFRYTDVEQFTISDNLTGNLGLEYQLTQGHDLYFTSLFVNKTEDFVYEQGRNGLGRFRDRRPPNVFEGFRLTTIDQEDLGAFDRDQNLKQTQLIVNQLHGKHRFGDNNKVLWGLGYNVVNADEPNRIRNEVSILTPNTFVEIPGRIAFGQRKSSQIIKDDEINTYLNHELKLPNFGDNFKLKSGVNYRKKNRDFESEFVAATRGRNPVIVSSLDNLSDAFNTPSLFEDGTFTLAERDPETYEAQLNSLGFYTGLDFEVGFISGNLGLRYEAAQIDLDFDTVAGQGEEEKNYDLYLPNVNLKFSINDFSAIRFASSITATLPEFKEIAPFNYVSPNGRVIFGNENLERSENYNLDLKYEFFPEDGGVLSAATFYKQIKNPINLTVAKGSTGFFTYANTGEQADVFGLELEGKYDVIKNDNHTLNTSFNFTRTWTNQDLSPDFQFNGNEENELQGASEYIINGALSYTLNKEKELNATLTGNWASDKIAVLGASSDLSTTEGGVVFDSNIVEKGFVTLDFTLSKELTEKLKVKLTARNLLDPKIEETQEILDQGSLQEELVSSYKKGRTFDFSISYRF